MQGLFPEGDFFTHVLYGLSWVQVGQRPGVAPATRDQARAALFESLEVFYNRARRHSSLGFVSPAEFERAYHLSHR